MYWLALGALVALAGGLIFWRIRRRRRSRLISLVALVREPFTFDPAVLAHAAGKVWQADLGDGASPGADGFVVGNEIMNTILHDGRMVLVNCFPRPYTEDVEQTAEGIGDLRIRELFRQHQGWFSCDALGINGTTPAEEVQQMYRRLGLLFAELLDERCLLIYTPDTNSAYPINEDTEQALRSADPLGGLQDTLQVPIVEVPADDPLMQQAVDQARRDWPQFVAAYEAQAGENFSIKAPVTHAGNTEFIWITVTALEGDRVYGELGNDPGNLGSLRLGSKVSVLAADLNDWVYFDPQGNLAGGFTIAAVQKASRRSRRT